MDGPQAFAYYVWCSQRPLRIAAAAAEASTTTSAFIAEPRLAQTAQEARTNALAAAVQQNVDEGAALLGLVQSQAATLATLGSSVAKIDQSSVGLNATMAMLLEKVTQLTEAHKPASLPQQINDAAVAATAVPINAEARQRPSNPPPPAEKRDRPEDATTDNADEDTQPNDAQRARSAQ